MPRYLYVTDHEGKEIEGSRRSIENCLTRDDVARLEAQLAAAMGEGCSVQDNVADWREFWEERRCGATD